MPIFSNPTDIREPLHPVVQLKFGTENFLVTIPPDNLQEFTHVSKWGADDVNFVFLDHTFGQLEARIFEADRGSRPVLYRWGYPGNGLEKTLWHQFKIRTYSPTLSHSGLRINLAGNAVGSEFATLIEPSTYFGKISKVVETIADEMGFKPKKVFIEETNDDANETRNTEWFSSNLTRIDMVRKLQDLAKSKANPNETYNFRLGSDGSFHFHTEAFTKDNQSVHGSTKDPEYRKFNVLYGQPNGVISFTPRYQAASIGAFAQTVVAGTLDPRSKQFQQRVLSRDSLGLTSKKADPKSGGRSTQGALSKSGDPIDQRRKANAYPVLPTKQVGIGGRCAGKTRTSYTEPDAALNQVENAYKQMQKYLGGGSLELHGLPEHADFVVDEKFSDIAVILPKSAVDAALQPQTPNGLHWSSGRYRLETITHVIAAGYLITAEMKRPWHLEGTVTAKTGAPSQPEKTTTKVL